MVDLELDHPVVVLAAVGLLLELGCSRWLGRGLGKLDQSLGQGPLKADWNPHESEKHQKLRSGP